MFAAGSLTGPLLISGLFVVCFIFRCLVGQHEHELQLCLPSTHSWRIRQDCESGDAGSILQVQRQERQDLGTVFAQIPVVTKSFDPPLNVPDSGYRTSLPGRPAKKPPREDGALCESFFVPDVPGASSMSVQLALNHTFVADTIIFIKNHRGHVAVLKYGDTSPGGGVDLLKEYPITFITNADRPAKQMGNTAVGLVNGNRVACKMAPEQCSFKPRNPTSHASNREPP